VVMSPCWTRNNVGVVSSGTPDDTRPLRV
jgi:hypothetical protein